MRKIDGILIMYIVQLIVLLYGSVTWIINLIQFLNCDFEGPYKEEIIKGIGVLIPPTNMITVWF